METKVPEVQPKRAEKTYVGVGLLAGIQRASTRTVERNVVIIIMLNRPIRSPSQPGTMRPTTLNENVVSKTNNADRRKSQK